MMEPVFQLKRSDFIFKNSLDLNFNASFFRTMNINDGSNKNVVEKLARAI